jgi:hypothetical protein
MNPKRSGQNAFVFEHRPDLYNLPSAVLTAEVNLHGGFAVDQRVGFGQIYYGMPGCGILRIDSDLGKQELIALPDKLTPMNFHSTKIAEFAGGWRLILAANDDETVAIVSLDGTLDFVLPRPEFEAYQAQAVPFMPTDTVLVENALYVADGYGANYITSADVTTKQWTNIFGGKTENPAENGKFTTAHGINLAHHSHQHLVIADRPSSRLQIHGLDGAFVESHTLPAGSWPCGINFIDYQGHGYAVVGSLRDPVENRPAPIYILDAETYAVLSVIRPQEDLGIEGIQHLHNVVWHLHNDQLYLVCQSWNPGHYFVLAQV